MGFKYRGVENREDLKTLIEEVPLTLTNLQGDRILPTIPVKNSSGDMKILPAGVGHKLTDLARADNGGYSRTKYELAEDNFQTRVKGAEEEIDNIASLETSDIFSEEQMAGAIARNRLLLGREKRVADAVFNTTTFSGADYSTTVGTKWDQASADFREDIWAAHEKTRGRLKISLDQMDLILTTDRIRDMINTLAGKENIKYTNAIDIANPATRMSALIQYIGVKSIIAVDSMGDVAGGGLEGKFEFLWNNTMCMLAQLSPTAGSWRGGGLGRQPVFTKLTSDYIMETYDEEANDKRIVRVKEQRGEKIFKGYGHLIKGIA